jgi:hypothetical protein
VNHHNHINFPQNKIIKGQSALSSNRTNRDEAQTKGQALNSAKAATFTAKMFPIINSIRSPDMSMTTVAVKLNEMGFHTALNGIWHRSKISRLLKAAPEKYIEPAYLTFTWKFIVQKGKRPTSL